MSFSKEYSRRAFIGALGAFLLVGCESAEAKEKDFGQGDVIRVGNQGFSLRNGGTYLIPDLPKFLEYTKADQYGIKVKDFLSISGVVKKFPLRQAEKRDFVVDFFAGNIKHPKNSGGEINFFSSGFMTDDQGSASPSTDIMPNKTFTLFRDKLKGNNFDFSDNVFFSYGQTLLHHFSAQDTFKDPGKNIDYALKQFEQLMIDFPFAQFNLVGHSLGGLFCLAIAMKYPYAINNLILLSSPVRGIERTRGRDVMQKLKELLPFIGDEQVSEYLFKRWESPTFGPELDAFGEFFTKSGKRLLIATAEDDPIVPKESVLIRGAVPIVLPVRNTGVFNIQGHGRTLEDLLVLNPSTQSIGKNLAGIY